MTAVDGYAAGLIFLVCLVVSWVLDRLVRRISKRFDTSTSEVFHLLANSQRAVLLLVGSALALARLGFDISTLVAGLGLTGFAVGFALKDAISNLAAGIMIVLYRPVELGDDVEIAGVRGCIVAINLRYVTLRDAGQRDAADELGGCHMLPNSLLLSNKLTVHQRQALSVTGKDQTAEDAKEPEVAD